MLLAVCVFFGEDRLVAVQVCYAWNRVRGYPFVAGIIFLILAHSVYKM